MITNRYGMQICEDCTHLKRVRVFKIWTPLTKCTGLTSHIRASNAPVCNKYEECKKIRR